MQQNRDDVADLDLEMLRTVIDLRYGLRSNVELGLEIPFLFTYSGILDGFIEDAEGFFGRERAWRPALSLRAAVKLPTGSTSRAFGSGEADGSVGVLLQQSLGRVTLYINGDITFPGEAFEPVSL
jgi:hypothetical protein